MGKLSQLRQKMRARQQRKAQKKTPSPSQQKTIGVFEMRRDIEDRRSAQVVAKSMGVKMSVKTGKGGHRAKTVKELERDIKKARSASARK